MYGNFITTGFGNGLIPFLLLMVWTLFWKGVALWTASKNESKPWFIALLIINTAGILEIVYIFFVAKKTFNEVFSFFGGNKVKESKTEEEIFQEAKEETSAPSESSEEK